MTRYNWIQEAVTSHGQSVEEINRSRSFSNRHLGGIGTR